MSGQRSIRVLLIGSRPRVSFAGATRAGGRALNPAKVYSASESAGGVLIRDARGKRVARFTAPVSVAGRGYVQLRGTAMNGVTSGNYRGALELRPGSAGGVTAVNRLG